MKTKNKHRNDNEIFNLFDETGNCKTLGNPYRDDRNKNNTLKLLFDEHGDLNAGIYDMLVTFVHKYLSKIHPLSDIVKLIIAEEFSRSTNNNYSTTCYWRN